MKRLFTVMAVLLGGLLVAPSAEAACSFEQITDAEAEDALGTALSASEETQAHVDAMSETGSLVVWFQMTCTNTAESLTILGASASGTFWPQGGGVGTDRLFRFQQGAMNYEIEGGGSTIHHGEVVRIETFDSVPLVLPVGAAINYADAEGDVVIKTDGGDFQEGVLLPPI